AAFAREDELNKWVELYASASIERLDASRSSLPGYGYAGGIMKTISQTLLALTATALLAACQSAPSATSSGASHATQAPGSDACKASSFQRLVGTPAAALDKSTLPGNTRILRPGTMATMDYRPDRLNIHVNDAGQITRV